MSPAWSSWSGAATRESGGVAKTAIILFNLGGPDGLAAVRPFLVNLFNDASIIALPQPLRLLIAWVIAIRRAPVARAIYARLGGASPLLPNTEAQARAMEVALGEGHRVFVAMRYWHPFSRATARAVKAWGPTEIVLLPLYPQFSTTTTGSSIEAWRRAARAAGLDAPQRAICCYPAEPGFIAAVATEIAAVLKLWPPSEKKRILFSAHGLPEKIVAGGDPYQWQVEHTVAALRQALAGIDPAYATLDSVVCYQSRVGPLAWIGPGTDTEIRRAGTDRVGLLVVPVAFVSEHSETLVELDIEYRHLAGAVGVPTYIRVPVVGIAPDFIAGLARLVGTARGRAAGSIAPAELPRLCPPGFSGCPCRTAPPP
jgi:protoporphyrin/coproporphyrin ferrochelatase